MQLIATTIDNDAPPGGSLVQKKLHQRAINAFCPYCGQRGTFLVGNLFSTYHVLIRPTSGMCPTCNEKVFFTFYYSPDEEKQKAESVTMYPSSDVSIQSIQVPQTLSDGLRKAIRDAENCYAAGLYSPALTSAGRALEGILVHLSGKSKGKKTLNTLLDEFSKSEDASAPIIALSHAIRNARNLGAHFDDFVEADRETASIMLGLLRYCIAYFFHFSDEAKRLDEIINEKNEIRDLLS